MNQDRLYSMSHLLKAMGDKGLEMTTKPTYLKYERMGVIKPGGQSIVYSSRILRVWTAEEIKENVERFLAWTKKATQI